MCASSAMLLPGISGSFMLLVFGVYGTVMLAISEVVKLNFTGLPILLAVGFGVLAGFIISSKIIQYFLTHHKLDINHWFCCWLPLCSISRFTN